MIKKIKVRGIMKKFSLLFVAVLTLCCGVCLAACNFKTPTLEFAEDVVMLSIGDEVNLDELSNVRDIDRADVEYRFSSTSFFERKGNVLSTTSFGQTMVYATYDGNSLDSFLLVVKKPFEQVANIQMDDFGLVTWNAVVDKFDDSEDFVTASTYIVDVHYVNEDESFEDNYTLTLSENSCQLVENGRYTLNVYAEAEGKFDRSPVSSATVYFGYMPELTYDDFTLDTASEEMTWNVVGNATYSVAFNGETLVEQSEENSINLSSALSGLESGAYTLQVTVHDKDGIKISKRSEELSVVKLGAPAIENAFDDENGGRMRINLAENALKAVAYVDEMSFEFEETENYTTFEGIDAGEHLVTMQSLAVESKRDGVFYANSEIVDGANIYKLDNLTISGRGDNEENADAFNYTATSSSAVTQTAIKTILILGGQVIEDLNASGFEIGETSVDREVALNGAGEYLFTAYNYAKSATITLDEELFLINSNINDSLSFVKLDTLTNVTHSYSGGVSTINFEEEENAETYRLQVLQDSVFVDVEAEHYNITGGVVTFTNSIENLFDENYYIDGTITFKIVAEREDELLSISSGTTKALTRLEAPTSESGNSGNVEYSWSAVDGAENYVINYAYIDEQTFDAGLDSISISDFDETLTTSATSLTLEAGNYYYIEIYATPLDENANLNSFVYRNIFYISKQLETPVVDFGLDEELLAGDFVEATGYFLEVENVENMAGLSVTLDEDIVDYNYAGKNSTIFLFSDEFLNTQGSHVEIVVSSSDSRLYPDSTPYNLTIRRLDASYSSINNYVSIDEFTSTYTLRHGMEGVSEMIVTENASNYATGTAESDAVLNIREISNSAITVRLIGSEFDEESKTYTITTSDADNFVYLDSVDSTYTLQRMNAPTDFTYYDGNFTFTTDVTFGEYFVLDMEIADVNGRNILMKVDIFSSSNRNRLAIYDADTMEVLNSKVTLSGGENVLTNSGNNYTLSYQTLLDLLKTDENFTSYYSQATEIAFSLYNHQIYFLNNRYTLSSFDASCLDGGTSLVVRKMPTPEVSYDKDCDMLVWSIDEENYGHLVDTEFEIYTYVDGDRQYLTTVTTRQYDVQKSSFELSTDYQYDVVASNPYYLESSSSRIITLHVLSPVERVTLSDNSLIFTPNSLDLSYITGVQYVIDDGGANVVTDKVDNSIGLEILDDGVYEFNYVGTTEFESDGRYYLDSTVTTYTLSLISSVAPSNTAVSYESNIVTFNALQADLQSLSYIIVFEDSEGNYATVTTKENSYAVSPESDICGNLNAGEITITVYAVLSSYSVSAGGTIYYNATSTTIAEDSYYNAYTYPQQATVLKLSTPSIDEIVFVGDNADALRPSIEIHITGEYGENDRFVVYVNNNTEIINDFVAGDVLSDGEYILTLEYDEYISYFYAGALNDIKVTVTSSENIPSSPNSTKVYFTNALESVSQAEVDYGFGKTIEITFETTEDLAYANGGIMLEITYQTGETPEQREYILIESSNFVDRTITYDLTDFILNNMQAGGSLSYRVFVNSFSNGETFILASDSIQSGSYEVLATPVYDAENAGNNSIELTGEGVIVGVTEEGNINESASYIISYTDGTNMVSSIIGAEEEYFFEYPDSWVSNENYTISIMAIEEGKISSTVTSVDILLQRLERVANVTYSRSEDDLSNVSLSWDAVENADTYITRAYVLNDDEKTYIGSVVESAETSVSIYDLFGENYESLPSYVGNGRDIYIEIISSSNSTYHNSHVRLVNTTLLGTLTYELDSQDMNVANNGELYFNAIDGQTYLYSIASVDGNTLYLPWTMASANSDNIVIDISKVNAITSDVNFRVRVMLAGDATTDGILYNDEAILLHLDSQYIQGSKVFMQSQSAEEVAVNTVDNSKLSVVVASEIVRVYASLSDSFGADEAVFIEGVYDDFLVDAGRYIYNLNMSLLLEQFDITGDTTIYFYVVQESIEDEIYYVVSKATSYNFRMMSAGSVSDVRKIVDGTSEDYVRTYIVFNERDDVSLTGFNIIVEYTNPNNLDETKRFNVMLQIDGTTYVDGAEIENSFATLSGNEILIDVYGLLEELNTVFEYDDITQIVSPNLSGEGNYMFYISEVGTVGEEIYYSPYISTFEERDLNFTKLPEALSVIIDSGNVEWEVDENYLNLMEKFYIYLYDNNNTSNFNRYETEDNTERTFDGNLFNCAENEYNVSLICVSSDPFVIASSERYVVDTANNIAVVVKNKFNSELTLSNGVLSIDWNSGVDWADGDEDSAHDIYDLLSGIREGDEVTQNLVTELTTSTFYYPFTFTLSDLVSGNVRLRFRFTSYADDDKTTIAFRRVADVDARYILTGELLGTSDLERLNKYADAFAANTSNATERTLIINFFNILRYSVGGIGNYRNIFDFAFEAIQEGKYEIEYCLLGNSSTLTSEWKVLTSGENQDYFVNPTVHVEAGFDDIIVDGEEDIVSAYYIKIYRTQIYLQDGTTTDASTYFMQIYNQTQSMSEKYGIEISTLDGGVSWNASLVGNDGASFSVTPVDGNDDGEYDYLKLYLNLSVDESGVKGYNAILSQYPDTFAKGSYYFEVFARGNNYSVSSKSSIYSMTLYNACQNFQITNGEFSWTAFQNLPTTIVYKATDSRDSSSEIVYPQEQSLSHFSLDNLDYGEYEYIKFATLGNISGNRINIDSEVYIVENVYKLSTPTVTTELNAFALQDNNRTIYPTIYTDDRSVKYEVNNNANTQNTSFIFTSQSYDSTATKSIYEAGTTNYRSTADDPDYIYKLTELNADEFTFSTLGSTASYTAERDGVELNVYNLVINNQGTGLSATAVKSNAVSISGQMLPAVPTASVYDGLVTWADISIDGLGLGIGNGTVVYEVGVQFYEITNTAQGTTTSNIGTEILAFTTGTTFDLAKVEDSFPALIGNREEYVRVTLQAYVLSVSETAPTGRSYVVLDDGRYAYGDQIAYTSLEPTEDAMPYILRSNGYFIESLSLAPSVTNLQVTDGNLTWQYETSDEVTFIVTDGDGNVIDGVVSTTDNLNYTFMENSGEIPAGDNTINVYAVVNRANILKSIKTSMDVYKLAPIEQSFDETGDYTIESITIDLGDELISAEIMDFANYFDKNDEEYLVNLQVDETDDYIITSDNSRILILSSQEDYDNINSLSPSTFDGYSAVLIVIDSLNINLKAISADDNPIVLSSDNYNMILNRPVADYTIVWNPESQTFSWNSETQVEDENTIFLVDATYMYMSNGRVVEENRRYEITYEDDTILKEFTPTIIGSVSFSLTVKYGSQGLQSQRMEYDGSVNFNLFTSGDGTDENPYVISNNEQFTNIAYRMTKLSYLNSHTSDGETMTDDSTRYTFSLNVDISDLTFDGILFTGEFSGNIIGGGHTISYTANAVATNNLSATQTASVGQITSLNTGDNGISFRKGLSLFETISGNISSLTINANYISSTVLRDNTLFSGLAIENMASAVVSDVAISGITSSVAVQNATEYQTVAVYAGLVAFNNGRILRGSVTGDIYVTDANTTGVQNIFVGGISYTSLGIIENSTISGNITLNLDSTGGGQQQVAGIAVTTTGTLQNNSISEGSVISATGVSGNSHTVYIGGIAVYARGTVSGNTYYENCTVATDIGNAIRNDNICNTGLSA